ncbi:hypothetical protein [Mycetocola reblochoni]|uniref:hypothetical protein n=1 Tax=Mycetocola reblochoni TaxID=331618 RepID=UPI003F9DE0A6
MNARPRPRPRPRAGARIASDPRIRATAGTRAVGFALLGAGAIIAAIGTGIVASQASANVQAVLAGQRTVDSVFDDERDRMLQQLTGDDADTVEQRATLRATASDQSWMRIPLLLETINAGSAPPEVTVHIGDGSDGGNGSWTTTHGITTGSDDEPETVIETSWSLAGPPSYSLRISWRLSPVAAIAGGGIALAVAGLVVLAVRRDAELSLRLRDARASGAARQPAGVTPAQSPDAMGG